MVGVILPDETPVQRAQRLTRNDLASRLRWLPEDIPDPVVVEATWVDSAMDIRPRPGERVTRGPTPGYVLRFRIGDAWHLYHVRKEDGFVKYDSRIGQ